MSKVPNTALPDLNKSGRFAINYPSVKSQNNMARTFPAPQAGTYSKSQSLFQYVHSSYIRTLSSPKSHAKLMAPSLSAQQSVAKIPESKKQPSFKYWSILGRRPTNEDAELVFAAPQGYTLVGIFDGHGGSRVSHLCAYELPRIFSAEYGEYAVNEVFRHSIDGIERIAFSNLQLDEQGCTFCSAFIDKQKIILCNVGDSRALVGLRTGGYKYTRDHSPEDKMEFERLSKIPGVFISNEFGIKRVQGSLCLTRAVGDKFMRPYGVISTPDLTEVPRGQAEWIFIACDGLFDVLSNDYVNLILRSIIRGVNLGTTQDEYELIRCAYLYFYSKVQQADYALYELVGIEIEQNDVNCNIDKEASPEIRICYTLCRLAYNLGSTDNISALFGFL